MNEGRVWLDDQDEKRIQELVVSFLRGLGILIEHPTRDLDVNVRPRLTNFFLMTIRAPKVVKAKQVNFDVVIQSRNLKLDLYVITLRLILQEGEESESKPIAVSIGPELNWLGIIIDHEAWLELDRSDFGENIDLNPELTDCFVNDLTVPSISYASKGVFGFLLTLFSRVLQ